MRSTGILIVLGVLSLLLSVACSENQAKPDRICTPGAYVFCRCENRKEGSKLCKEDGESFGACSPCDESTSEQDRSGESDSDRSATNKPREEEPPAPTAGACTKDTDCNALGRICESGDCVKGCR